MKRIYDELPIGKKIFVVVWIMIALFMVGRLPLCFLYQLETPKVDVQKKIIIKEVCDANIEKMFIPIENDNNDNVLREINWNSVVWDRAYNLYADEDTTFKNIMEIHKRNGWILEKYISGYKLTMTKDKLRLYVELDNGGKYGFETYPSKFIRVRYRYRDGWFEE